MRRLSDRNVRDERERIRIARLATPSERLDQALELCDLARELARSVGATWVSEPAEPLRAKMCRYPVRR